MPSGAHLVIVPPAPCYAVAPLCGLRDEYQEEIWNLEHRQMIASEKWILDQGYLRTFPVRDRTFFFHIRSRDGTQGYPWLDTGRLLSSFVVRGSYPTGWIIWTTLLRVSPQSCVQSHHDKNKTKRLH
jgi:hypothetical protein